MGARRMEPRRDFWVARQGGGEAFRERAVGGGAASVG